MKQKTTALLLTVPVALFVLGPVVSRKDGILPSTSRTLTRTASNSCGSCHGGNPGGPTVRVAPTARSLVANQSISITVSGTGGPPGNSGGLAADVTGGAFVASSNTRISASGNAITHTNPNTRSWTFGYRAPATPGAIEFYTVVNAADGNGKSSGDRWAFHGARATETISTPVRFFVNAPGVVPIGRGCADGYGNVGVYGASITPTVGNPNFKLEGIGLPPNARVMFILGVQKNVPSIDLSAMGAPGCFLHSDIAVEIHLQTTGGSAERAEGRFTLPAAIPNDPTLKGFFFRSQIGVLDGSPNARPFPVVFTNAIGVTIQ